MSRIAGEKEWRDLLPQLRANGNITGKSASACQMTCRHQSQFCENFGMGFGSHHTSESWHADGGTIGQPNHGPT